MAVVWASGAAAECEPIITEGIGYHHREGGHDLTAWDWMQFLLFLDKNDA